MTMENNDIFQEILSRSPSPSTIRIILNKLMTEGYYGRVIQEATRAISADPDDVSLMIILAQAYEKAGFLGKAEDMLAQACAKLDSFAMLFKKLAELYARNNRSEDAIEALNKYIAHCPDDEEAAELLRQLQPAEKAAVLEEEMGEHEAVPPEETTSASSPEPSSLQELATPTLAEIYFNQGQIEEAISIYESVLERHPEDHEAAKRLEELRALAEQKVHDESLAEEIFPQDDTAIRKEKLIAVLSTWLGKIQEMNRAL